MELLDEVAMRVFVSMLADPDGAGTQEQLAELAYINAAALIKARTEFLKDYP